MSYEVYRNGFIVAGIILGIVAYLVYDWESEIVGLICAGIAALFIFLAIIAHIKYGYEKTWNEAKAMVKSDDSTVVYIDGNPVDDDFNFDAISLDNYTVKIDGNNIYLEHD